MPENEYIKTIVFAPSAMDDLNTWKQYHPQIFNRIIQLIKDIQVRPFKGIGKPEPLRHQYQKLWSRRINKNHRLIYEVKDTEIVIISCRGHYE